MKSTTQKKNANRANAKKSTGPKSDLGKSRTAKNGIIHGLRSPMPVLPGVETEEDWNLHKVAIIKQLEPNGAVETAMAERIALGFWRLARCARYEGELFESVLDKHRWNTILSELRYEEKKCGSVPAAFERIRSEAKEWAEFANVWDAILKKSKPRSRVEEAIAGAVFDQAVKEWQWEQLKENFDKHFSWPPQCMKDFWEMINWCSLSCSKTPEKWIQNNATKARDKAHELAERIKWIEQKVERSVATAFFDDDISQKLMRYETTIHRALTKDMHELQRLQAMRIGVTDAIPVAIDIATDG